MSREGGEKKDVKVKERSMSSLREKLRRLPEQRVQLRYPDLK